MGARFSFARVAAVLKKEFIQMRRDRITLGMILGVPVLQLFLFGFAINLDPKHLPTALTIEDPGTFSNSIVAGLMNSDYFHITHITATPKEGARLLDRGEVSFVIDIPANFSRDLVRGRTPQILIAADATDPASGTRAVGSFAQLATSALRDDLTGPLAMRASPAPPFEVVVQPRYNPENNTQYNIVPGLLGVILTMTMVLMTAMAVTRERERGTLENLLAMPARPLEIMLGKIAPYIGVGVVQSALILLAARYIFGVPMLGSLTLLSGALVLFIAANLAVGFTFSTVAKSQLQAMQMMVFFLLPSILLSGFAFPFQGMPGWAQGLGEVLPITHFLRIVRGVLLKGNGLSDIWSELWPLALFMLAAGGLAMARFRRTLD